MRTLIYIPVIHTQVDMGSMAGSLKEAYVERFGQEKWASHIKAIDQMWEGIKRKIEALDLDVHKTKLYQDGLPICGKEMEIVTELAVRESRNYQILYDLVKKGCVLIGTESPELLLQEYNSLKEELERGTRSKSLWRRLKSSLLAHRILHARDRFIAQRILETLQDEETGILFMGIHHQVDRYLAGCLDKGNPHGITIRYLFHRLPFQYSRRFGGAF